MAIDDATLPASVEVTCKKAAKDARRAMQLTLFAVAVAIVVLAIDHGIKRAIISEAQDVREIFAHFQEATRGLQAAIQDGTTDSPADSPDDAGSGGLADGAGTRPAPSSDAGNGKPPGPARKGSARARP